MAQSNNVTKLGAAVLAEMLDSDSDLSDDKDNETNKKRRKRLFNRETAMLSLFYLRYLKAADECQDPLSETSIFNDNSQLDKVFCRRFRIPYSMFVHLCLRYEGKADDRKSHDATGRTKHGVRLLALGTFRLIPRDLVFDDLDEELDGISATADRGFFFSFLSWLAGLANTYIVLPRTDEELLHVSALYQLIGGIPGCAGLADCVHVFWDVCPANLQSRCKAGKEKFPSLV
jgi:hypothetical protein